MFPKIKNSLAVSLVVGLLSIAGLSAAHADTTHAVISKDTGVPVSVSTSVATSEQPAKPTDKVRIVQVQKYTVVSGDTLSAISLKYLGTANDYPQLAVINHIPNPDLIFPGQVFILPDKGSLSRPAAIDSDKSPSVPVVKSKVSSHASSRSTSPSTRVVSGSPQAIARSLMSATDFGCFNYIITHESGWSVTATNPSSGAYGLPQALPGSKMASAGADWRTSAYTQIKWAIGYMDGRYGSICGAYSWWVSHSWY